MTRVALRGLAGRKFRASLTALAIVLGVAMISGSLVLTDTIDRAFDRIFVESYAGTDAVVSGASSDIKFEGETAESPPIPAALLDEVRAVSTVDVAAGSILEQTAVKILDRKGDPIVKNAPTFGFGIDASVSRFNPLELKDGRWPTGPAEVVIDSGTAEDERYGVGDRVQVATVQPVREFEVVGIAQYGGVESLGGATFAVFDVPTAQQLLDQEGTFDAIQVAAKAGTSPEELVADLESALGKRVTVRSGVEQASEDSEEVAGFVTFIRYFLLTFGFIALFVGAFVIFNTLSITVAQRTRELATLRTLGASRRQVLTSVLVEAFVIGALASVIGLFLGFGLAKLLNWLFKLLELELPTTGLVFATRTVVVALLVGILVTVVAGLAPALRATRVPPISAVREGATLPTGRLSRYTSYIAGVLVALAVALLGYSLFADELEIAQRLLSIAGGVLALFIGVALLSPKLVRPLARALAPVSRWVLVGLTGVYLPVLYGAWLVSEAATGWTLGAARRAVYVVGGLLLPAAYGALVALVLQVVAGPVPSWLLVVPWLVAVTSILAAAVLLLSIPVLLVLRARGAREVFARPAFERDPATEQLARENSRRNPGRTAATAAALMIGIALVTFVSVLAQGMRESNRDAITGQIKSDFVITSEDGYSEFVAGVTDAAATAPNAELVTDVRQEIGQVAGAGQNVTGVDPEQITAAYSFEWKEGSDAVLAELGRSGAIVAETFADDKDLAVGDAFTLRTPGGRHFTLTVKGIYEPPPFYPLLGAVTISRDTWDSVFESARNRFTFVNVPGEPTTEAKRAIDAAVKKYPDARVQTRQEWIDKEDSEFQQFVSMLYILLALSVIVSVFGIVNTLVLSVFERTRELGMLRAVGMTRSQTRRLIRHESVITALLGAALGLPLGIFLAALVTEALGQWDVQFRIPATPLEIFVVAAIFVGIVAALLPARRAARLDVLQALQYE